MDPLLVAGIAANISTKSSAEPERNPSSSSSLYSEHETDEIPLLDLTPACPVPPINSGPLPTIRPDSPTLPPIETSPSPSIEDEEDDMKKFAAMLAKIEAKKTSDASILTSDLKSSQTGESSESSRARHTTAHATAENKAAYAAYVKGKATGYGTYGAAIPEPTAPEHCYPDYGVRSNVTADAEIWYAGIRHMLRWGIKEMKFADGKYINVITDTYPLRDSLNKIMWDDSLTTAEGAALVRLGRIYARAQGEAKDGVLINRNYIERTGLDDMADALLDIFRSEAQRRTGSASAPSIEIMAQLNDTINRLQLQVAHDLEEKEAAAVVNRVAAADKAAKELIEEEETEQAKATKSGSQTSSKSKAKGKKGKGKH